MVTIMCSTDIYIYLFICVYGDMYVKRIGKLIKYVYIYETDILLCYGYYYVCDIYIYLFICIYICM